jgi:PAS domain S-box-containing protein
MNSVNLSKGLGRYQNLIENLPVGVLIIINERIDYANPNALKLLGIDEEKAAKLAPVQFLHPSYRNEFDLLINGIKSYNSGC